MSDDQQGVAQRLIREIDESVGPRPTKSFRLAGMKQMYDELSREARAELAAWEIRINESDYDIERQVVCARKRDAVRQAFERLGLDLDEQE